MVKKEKLPRAARKTLAGTILSAGMAVAVVSVIFFSWIAEEVFEGESLKLDNSVREFVHSYAAGWLTSAMQFFAFLGSTAFLTAATVLCVLILVFRRLYRPAVLLAVVMTGAVILNYALKVSLGRPRPLPFFDTPLPESFSFPSGHALFAVCFYGMLAWIITSKVKGRSLQISAWTIAALIALLIGLSRVYLGVHFLTDIIAGYAAAVVWISVVVLADSVLDRS